MAKTKVFLILLILLLSTSSGKASTVAALVKSQLTARYMPNPSFYLREVEYAKQTLSNMGIKVVEISDTDLEQGKLNHKDFPLLILPNVKNMSEKSAMEIKKYATYGRGKVLAFYMTSYRTENDETARSEKKYANKNNFQLAELFGADFFRWSNGPPLCQFLQPGKINYDFIWRNTSSTVELGRNTAMMVKPYPNSKILAVWSNALDGKTPTLPVTLGAGVVENAQGSCIYIGENLLVPENLKSKEVRSFLSNLINHLFHSWKLHPENKPPATITEFPLHSTKIKAIGRNIRIGIEMPVKQIVITASTSFKLFNEANLVLGIFSKGTLVKTSILQNKLIITLPSQFSKRQYTARHITIKPLQNDGLVSYIDSRKNGSYQTKWFRGELELRPHIEALTTSEKLQLINIVDLNLYLAGVVPHEVPFHFPHDALAAMAIVGRTFTLHSIGRHSANGYDLCNSVHCQTYEGVLYEAPPSTLAVSKTGRIAIFYKGELADTTYHSTCGGITENISHIWNVPQKPYLISILDMEETIPPSLNNDYAVNSFLANETNGFCRLSSRYRWEEVYTQEELEQLFTESLPVLLNRPIPPFKFSDIKVVERTSSGRVARLLVIGDKEEYMIPKDKVRWLFSSGKIGLSGLQSNLFTIQVEGPVSGESEPTKKNIRIRGGGWGHGVGMCQFGARGMAQIGADYKQILQHYYPGTTLLP